MSVIGLFFQIAISKYNNEFLIVWIVKIQRGQILNQ